MRKSLAALGLVFFLVFFGLYFAQQPRATLPPTVVFVGFLPPDDWRNWESRNRKAVFKMTNSTLRCICASTFTVEVFTNGGWQMHSFFRAGTLIKSSPTPHWPLFLEPGASETLALDAPEGRHWRLATSYTSENFGIRALLARIRAVRQDQNRDWGVLWRKRFRSFEGLVPVQSDAIPAGPE
jgi:hypothetical protein